MNEPSPAYTFDNAFIRDLAVDDITDNYTRQVEGACSSLVQPTPTSAPQLIAHSPEVADILGFDQTFMSSDTCTKVLSGNALLPGMEPYAMCYGGHQFGNWAGQLGDGRAINLGELINDAGQRWVLQLKGAGPTPYSRRADGLAVLRSSVREFLCSETMHHLGVPTTRALSLCLSGDQVLRDMLYDGNAAYEPGAIVCRVAESFIRFGNFQILTARKDHALLRQLSDFTIQHHFAHLLEQHVFGDAELYVAWYREICQRTVTMILHWYRVGFVHGVMNTDNMSILGQTIDYGPYGWLEDFNLDWTPNTTDAQSHRYAYGRQADIACWNLVQLANALVPLIGEQAPLEAVLDEIYPAMNDGWKAMMLEKAGLHKISDDDRDVFIRDTLEVLSLSETDYCIFYRLLADYDEQQTPGDGLTLVRAAFYKPEEIAASIEERWMAWFSRYQGLLSQQEMDVAERKVAMNAMNPKYVLRNYMAQEAIDLAVKGDYTRITMLLDVLRHPYDEQPEHEQFAAKRPDWARERVGCSMLSCSS